MHEHIRVRMKSERLSVLGKSEEAAEGHGRESRMQSRLIEEILNQNSRASQADSLLPIISY